MQTMKAILKAVIIQLTVCLPAMPVGAQSVDCYATNLLAEMAEALGMQREMDTISEGCHVAELSFKGRPLSVIKSHGKISHIGYSIFSSQLRDAMPSPFYDVTERYALIDALRLKRIRTVGRELEEEGVRFRTGDIRRLPSFFGKDNVEFSLRNENGRIYIASWKSGNELLEEITMPYTYEFLHGLDMEENESRLLSDLAELKEYDFTGNAYPAEVRRQDLIPHVRQNYFIKPGDSYYFDHLNGNRYYTSTDSTKFEPIYSKELPLESLANVITSLEVSNDIRLKIKLVAYNFKDKTVTVPLSSFIEYAKQRGCSPFFGVMESNAKEIMCLLILRNENEGYAHLLKINVPAESAGTPSGLYAARMNSYIPISKISSLFPLTDNP